MKKIATNFRHKLKPSARLWFLLIISLAFSKTVFSSGAIMIDLSQPNEYKQWRTTNDNVMGGISQGSLSFDGQSSAFFGDLSLVNNGGFSSIARSIEPLPMKMDKVELVFAGDGRTYQLRLATSIDGYRVTYKHEFSSIKGQRQKKLFELSNFQAVFRGKLLTSAPVLSAQDINQVGLLIADKQAGPFRLNLTKIEFRTSQESNE